MKQEKIKKMNQFFNDVVDTYEEVHIKGISGGMKSKDVVASLLPDNVKVILDLGCGTGLELEKIFERFPNVKVVGIDLSSEMLKKLKEKFRNKNIDLVCQSYFDYNFGINKFDSVISVMSLHHFTHTQKELLYKRICDALKEGGVFINSDYIVEKQEEEDLFFETYAKESKNQGLKEGIYHYDTPLTEMNEKSILTKAGFVSVNNEWEIGHTKVLVARK